MLRRGWEVALETRAAPGGSLAGRGPAVAVEVPGCGRGQAWVREVIVPDVFDDRPWVVELEGVGPSPLAAGVVPGVPAAGAEGAAAGVGAGR